MMFWNAHSKSLHPSAGGRRTAKKPWFLVARTHKALMIKTHNSESFQNHSWIFKQAFYIHASHQEVLSPCLDVWKNTPPIYYDMGKIIDAFFPFLPLILFQNKESQQDTLMNFSPIVGSPQTRPARRAIWLQFKCTYLSFFCWKSIGRCWYHVPKCLLLVAIHHISIYTLYISEAFAGATSCKVCSCWSTSCSKGCRNT